MTCFSKLKKEILIPIDDIHAQCEIKQILNQYAPLLNIIKRKREKVQRLTREDKRRIKVINLNENNYSNDEIAKRVKISKSKIKYSLESSERTQKILHPKRGRKPVISEKETEFIRAFYAKSENSSSISSI